MGELAKGFTFQEVARIAAGFGQRLLQEGKDQVVVGHDARFLAREMAEEAAGVLSGMGLKTHLLQGPAPFPLFGYALHAREAAGLYLTASRKPPRFQGSSSAWRRGSPFPAKPHPARSPSGGQGKLRFPGPQEGVPGSSPAKRRGGAQGAPRGGLPGRHGGSWRGALGAGLQGLGLKAELRELHTLPHPLFYGADPDPRPENLKTLLALLKAQEPPALGFALDGDADRLAAYRVGGEAVGEEEVLEALREVLEGLEVQGDGEGGFLFPWHLPEKDPYLAALLLLRVLL